MQLGKASGLILSIECQFVSCHLAKLKMVVAQLNFPQRHSLLCWTHLPGTSVNSKPSVILLTFHLDVSLTLCTSLL